MERFKIAIFLCEERFATLMAAVCGQASRLLRQPVGIFAAMTRKF
jgi:hypothetical protein